MHVFARALLGPLQCLITPSRVQSIILHCSSPEMALLTQQRVLAASWSICTEIGGFNIDFCVLTLTPVYLHWRQLSLSQPLGHRCAAPRVLLYSI